MNDLISREAAIIALMDVEADQIQTKNGIEIIDVIQSVSTIPAIPIPENATNGDVIKALFPTIKTKEYRTFIRVIDGEEYCSINYKWWNAPYKRGDTE